jgi:hypothetical protein
MKKEFIEKMVDGVQQDRCVCRIENEENQMEITKCSHSFYG